MVLSSSETLEHNGAAVT